MPGSHGGRRRTVYERFAAQARRSPHRRALASTAGDWTYGELAITAGELANRLRSLGVGLEAPVAVWGSRREAVVPALLAVGYAGAAGLVLDPREPVPRLRRLLDEVRPAAWLQPADAPAPAGLFAEQLAQERVVPVPAIPPSTFGEFLPSPLSVPPEAAGWITATSGTTGRPRTIIASHRPLSDYLELHVAGFGLGPEDRFAMLSSLGHDPLLRDVFAPLNCGAEVHVPKVPVPGDGGELRDWMARSGITVLHATPVLIEMLSGAPPEASTLPALRRIFVGGDILTSHCVGRVESWAPNAVCANVYGSSETPQVAASHLCTPADLEAGGLIPVGRGIEGSTLRLVDPRRPDRAARGRGLVAVTTTRLARGYLDDPRTTAERFRPDPGGGSGPGTRVFLTGDLATRRANGEIVVHGRCDDQVSVRGFRIEPAEIQAVLEIHPSVAEVHVGRDPGRGEPRLAAWVVLQPAKRPGGDDRSRRELLRDLRRFARDRLPEPMVPTAWSVLGALPRNRNGKVNRAALPAPRAGAGEEAGRPPWGRLETAIARAWEEVLGEPPAGVEADFFAAGGHSLAAVRLVGRLRRQLDLRISAGSLMEAPTVLALARRTSAQSRRPEPSVQVGGGRADRGPQDLPVRAARQSGGPLSHQEEALWRLGLLPGQTRPNVCWAVDLQGRVDAARLRGALDRLFRRHEALRSRVEITEEGPRRQVERHPRRPAEVDLRSLPTAIQAEQIATMVRRAVAWPLDADGGAAVQIALLHRSPRLVTLLLVVDHLFLDAWSEHVLLDDLATLYGGDHAEDPTGEASAPRYSDFARWQRQRQGPAEIRRRAEAWERRLSGARSVLDRLAPRRPPTGSPRPALVLQLSAEQAQRVEALAAHHRTSLFLLGFAAFQVFVHRHSGGATDLVVSTFTAGRPDDRLERVVGCFASLLPIRGDLDGDPRLPELLDRLRHQVAAALEDPGPPFERVVLELAPRLDVAPAYELVFQSWTAPLPRRLLRGLRVVPAHGLRPVNPAGFEWGLSRDEEGLSLTVSGNHRRWTGADLAALGADYLELLDAFCEAPEARLGELAWGAESDAMRRTTAAHPVAAEEHFSFE